jgi:hypothetical protein
LHCLRFLQHSDLVPLKGNGNDLELEGGRVEINNSNQLEQQQA